MADTYAKWAGYRHPDWEMNLSDYHVTARISPRGRIVSHIVSARLEGQIQATGVTDINTRLNEIINAYYTQNSDFEFYVDGVLTPHKLLNSQSVSGNKVMQLVHPRGDGAEFANKRTVAVVLQGEYENAESQLYEWHETIRWVGNCGPRDEWFPGFLGPVRQQVCEATTMHIIQSGYAVGWAGYVTPPGPAWPLIEHQWRRIIDPGHPKFLGQAHRLYGIRWEYQAETDNYTETFPIAR